MIVFFKLGKHIYMYSLTVFAFDAIAWEIPREISEALLTEYTEITENKSPKTRLLHQLELQKQLGSSIDIISELCVLF